MIFGYVILAVAVTISLVAAYYSIMGLTAIFAAAVVPIIIMGGALELGKIVSTVWLHNNWRRAPFLFKAYLVPAVAFLMFLTSMGIFGFLSKAHTDQALVSGDVTARIAIYDEKIKLSKDNIEANRKALKQMDEAVDQTMARSGDEKGAERAVQIRRSQNNERQRLLKEIDSEQKKITALNEERAPIAAEVRKVEAEVGPIKYIAALVYGDQVDTNLLEKAVRWVIILIVIVFDPLALCLILAANKQFEWALRGEGGWVHDDPEPKNILKNWTSFFKRPPITDFNPRPDTPKESDVDLEQVNRLAAEAAEEARVSTYEGSLVVEKDEIEDKPFRGQGLPPAMPLTASYQQAKIEDDEVKSDPWMEDLVLAKEPEKKPTEEETIAEVSRLIAEETLQATEPNIIDGGTIDKVPETARGINRRVIYSQAVQADNTNEDTRASNSDFGNEFPKQPQKGDVYLRTDYLPNRLYKFNGKKWIEVDKNQIDVYAYDNLYIKHLINEIDAGRYDPDSLTEVERQQIKEYLERNA